jgi:signal transduction histidine kinase
MGEQGTLTVSLELSGKDWEINFADTGPGMPPQLIEKIFEPFQSNFEGGTGLGLAIVYQIVQAHDGKVWARSKPGQGSIFVLRLREFVAANNVPETTLGLAGDAANAAPLSTASAVAGGARG